MSESKNKVFIKDFLPKWFNKYSSVKVNEEVPQQKPLDILTSIDEIESLVSLNMMESDSEESIDNSERKNDREEIRRKLAMDSDGEDYYGGEKMCRKPNLTTRLQGAMNLQICFMNEALLEGDPSPIVLGSNKEKLPPPHFKDNNISNNNPPNTPKPLSFFSNPHKKLTQLILRKREPKVPETKPQPKEDLATLNARLQSEARVALSQAREMARVQMDIERQRRKMSPITEIPGLRFPEGKRHLSRQLLTNMNLAQLQIIVNNLHSQIENLNEQLVGFLLERDDLHMQQDSMLVDIEDLTRYLGLKSEENNSSRYLTSDKIRKEESTKLKKLSPYPPQQRKLKIHRYT